MKPIEEMTKDELNKACDAVNLELAVAEHERDEVGRKVEALKAKRDYLTKLWHLKRNPHDAAVIREIRR